MAFCPICGRSHGPEEACLVPRSPGAAGGSSDSKRKVEHSADRLMLPLLVMLAAVAIIVAILVMLRI